MTTPIVYVSVSGGIADAEVVQGEVIVHQIDWDAFDDVDLTDHYTEEYLGAAYETYRALPPGRTKDSVRRDVLEILRTRSRDKRSTRLWELEKREARIAAARRVLAEEGEAA